jgi:peptidoglycan/xylan/chitin deacetylase (PgdA/CDA1 family)
MTLIIKSLARGVLFAALSAGALPAAAAVDCPMNPGAIGTSRTIVVDPAEHPRIGTMQYAETLPLADHEVVLTFDDGPIPAHTDAILDILAAQCVKATFFMVGRMANEFPDTARRVRDEGHTIGTHSQNHPFRFGEMQAERIKSEIEDGLTSVTAAIGEASVAPFFRVPGLRRAEGVESYLASRGIMIWSADFPADDWRHISSTQVIRLALSRIQAKGKGILLLHDIQERTQAALPTILHELKVRGYRIVHVVPATAERMKTATLPAQWLIGGPGELTPMTKLSAQSIWLAHTASAHASENTFQLTRPADASSFGIAKPTNRDNADVGDADRLSLPGSWPIPAAGLTASPVTAPQVTLRPSKRIEDDIFR